MCATKPSKRARWMKGRCAEYALTSRFVCSLLGMSLDWTAMTGSSRRITEDLRQPKCAAAEASGVAWGSARHRSRAVARDCARRSRKTPGSGVAARGGKATAATSASCPRHGATRRSVPCSPRSHLGLPAILCSCRHPLVSLRGSLCAYLAAAMFRRAPASMPSHRFLLAARRPSA